MSKFVTDDELVSLYRRYPNAVPAAEYPRVLKTLHTRHSREIAQALRAMSLKMALETKPGQEALN